MRLLDTDVLIDVLRGHPPAVEWFGRLEELPAVPGFSVMELIQDAEDRERVRKAMKLVEPLDVLWPTPADCERALAEFQALHLSHGLGLLDALIAATAVGHSAALLTFNHRHYKAVAGLVLEAPYER